MDQFPRRDVERSFRKFNDIVSDLISASFQTWRNSFTHLIQHCEQDQVMRVITEPLRSNSAVDASKWYADAMATVGGMIGSGRYQLPYNDDDRTALLYQFFLNIQNKGLSVDEFCMAMYGTTRFQEMVDTFSRELVLKFTREVSYRLDEILQDVGDQQTVAREAMVVFHHHDHSTTIHGDIQGSNVAASGGSVSASNATFNSATELARALKSLSNLVNDIPASHRSAVQQAIDLLVAAASSSAHNVPEITDAAKTVSKASPALAERLKEIALGIGTSLVTSSIVQGIKMAIGL